MKSKITIFATAIIAFTVLSGFAPALVTSSQINTSASTVKWTGYHLAKSYEHNGLVKVKSGKVDFNEGTLIGGNIVIDMTSLSNTDLTKAKDNQKLVKDLKSERFFNVATYPEASLVFTEVKKVNGSEYNVKADIEIRGIKEAIEFTLKQSTSGGSTAFDGKLEIDRIKHKVMYGWSIENAMLSNNFDLDVHIVVQTDKAL